MKFKVLTLFPEMIEAGLKTSITGRAIENGLIELETVNIRDFSQDKHGKVDDYTYGGGAGMLMQAQPVYDAWRAQVGERIKGHSTNRGNQPVRTIYVTPQGRLFSQSYAAELAREEELIFLCGHYEGVDQRVLDEIVTDYVSIGDYVLTGGELPAMVMIDAVSRLVPGVLHNEESAETESFHRSLLEYPQYSRPEVWQGKKVPEILLSGDHRKIAEWRLEQSKRLTKERRPDLYEKYGKQEETIRMLTREKRLHIHMIESLRRGHGELIYSKDGAVCIYDAGCRMGLFTVMDAPGEIQLKKMMTEMLDAVPQKLWCEMRLAVTTAACLNVEVMRRVSGSPLHITAECRQACYTQRNPLPVRHKDIRLLGENALGYLTEHYPTEGETYLAGRLRAKALYGAFVENELAGFAGWHSDGSIGLLYVAESFRGQGIGAALEAYCINRHLEMGYVPYGQIRVENEISCRMQETLGLYLSDEHIWWLERSE